MRYIMLIVRYIFLGSAMLFVSVSSANAAVFDGFDGEVFNYQYYENGGQSTQADFGDKTVVDDPADLANPEVSNIFIGLGTMDLFNTGFEINFDFHNCKTGDGDICDGRTYFFDGAPLSGVNMFELTDTDKKDNGDGTFGDGTFIDFEAFLWEFTTNTTAVTLSNVIFGTNMKSIGIDWSGITVNVGDSIRMEVVGAVPVPAAIWLFGSALLGLVGMSRRRKAS